MIANCVVIALTNPSLDPDSTYSQVLRYLDMSCNALMTLESLIRLIAMGLIMEKGTYLRDPWSAFDAIVLTARCVKTHVIMEISHINVAG